MFEDEEIRKAREAEKRQEKSGKYKPLARNKRTELEVQRIFDYGTERELMNFLRKNGVPDESERFAQIARLFREHGGKRR